MIPMAKKSGRTVFGVRIGLRNDYQPRFAPEPRSHVVALATHCQAFNRCCLNAVSVGFANRQHVPGTMKNSSSNDASISVDVVMHISVCRSLLHRIHSLAGLLLFFFFPSTSLSGSSCEFIESVCPTPGDGSAIIASVCRVFKSRCFRGGNGQTSTLWMVVVAIEGRRRSESCRCLVVALVTGSLGSPWSVSRGLSQAVRT